MKSTSRIPSPIYRYLQNLNLEDREILSEVSEIFSSEHELVTHFGFFKENEKDFLLFDKQQFLDKKIIVKMDYICASGSRNYVAEKKEKTMTIDGIDGIETEVRSEFSLVGKSEGIVKTLIRDYAVDFDVLPIFVANVSGGRCSILGFSWSKNLTSMTDGELEYLHYSSDLVLESLFDILLSDAKFKVKVHSSIYDRVKNNNYSFPSDWVTQDKGILKHPSYISFSPNVEKEVSLDPGTDCIISRDKDSLLVIIREGEDERLITLPFGELIDSGGKLRSTRVETSVKRNLALSRDGEQISESSLKTRFKSIGTGKTRMGLAFKSRTLGAELSQHGTYLDDDGAKIYSKIIPQLIFLRFAKYSNNLWNKKELRWSKKDRIGSIKDSKSNRRYSRILNWGTDEIRYISPTKGSKIGAHYVDSHPHAYLLSRQETIAEYQKKKRRVFKKDGQTYGIRFIESYLRGTGNETNWDGNYNFGRRPRNYSQMAIRWLEWVMAKDGIHILHAELGGEQRFSLSNGRSIMVDGWCEETNTVYEFHGDAFHGNPEVYAPDEHSNPFRKDVTAGELYRKTKERENQIIALGLNLVTIWERDWLEIEGANK